MIAAGFWRVAADDPMQFPCVNLHVRTALLGCPHDLLGQLTSELIDCRHVSIHKAMKAPK